MRSWYVGAWTGEWHTIRESGTGRAVAHVFREDEAYLIAAALELQKALEGIIDHFELNNDPAHRPYAIREARDLLRQLPKTPPPGREPS